MKKAIFRLRFLLREIIGILTSGERIKQLYHVRLYSNAVYLMIATGATSILGFVFWVVIARIYPAGIVGLASATIAAMGLVAALSRLGLEMGLVRYLHRTGEDTTATINTLFTISLLVSVLTAFIFIAGLDLWSPALLFIRENPVYLAAFILFTAASTLSVFADHAFIARRRAGFAMARSLIFNLVKLPLPIALAVFFQSFGIFSSWGVSLMVALLVSIFVFLPRVQPGYRFSFTIKRRVIQDIFRFSLANYISNLLWEAPATIFPLFLLNLLGSESNAFFYMAWAIGSLLLMIPSAVSVSLFAEGSHDEESLKSSTVRSLKMTSLILIPAVILVIIVSEKLMLVFGDAYSTNATSLLRILAVANLPLAINIIYLGIKRVQEDLKTIVIMTAFMAAVSLGLGYVLIPRLGIDGPGIAWLAGHGFVALLIVVKMLKKRAVF
jgi:O-antigen/teichoic acid export membrane protein